jgi:Holliday junction resolvasome RuvABC endonuclease subunit
MTAGPRNKGLLLAAHPTTRGFGWVLFEAPLSVLDWGIASAKAGRNARLIARFERLLKRYEPTVFVLEEFEGHEPRTERIQALCREMAHLALLHGADTVVFPRTAVRSAFAGSGATTRHEIAEVVAKHLDALSHRLPKKRKSWNSEDARQSLFDAAALALTYFARVMGSL